MSVAMRSTYRLSIRTVRTAVAAFGAGPLGTMIFVVLGAIWSIATGRPEARDPIAFLAQMPLGLLQWGQIGALIGWPAMLFGGLPAHALLLRTGKTAAWTYVLAGIIVGGIAAPVWAVFFAPAMYGTPVISGHVTLGVIVGGLSALVAWLIRRPDRDHSVRSPETNP